MELEFFFKQNIPIYASENDCNHFFCELSNIINNKNGIINYLVGLSQFLSI